MSFDAIGRRLWPTAGPWKSAPVWGVAPSGSPWQSAWANAFAAQQAGAGQAHVACFGDSVTQGYYSTAPYYANGWSAVARASLASRTGQSAGSGWIPMKEEWEIANDDRLTAAGTWVNAVTGPSFFRNYYYMDSAGDTFTFGPVSCSSFRVMYLQVSGGGSFTAKVDGSLVSTISCNGATAVVVATVSVGAPGSHTLLLEWQSGQAFPIAVEAISNSTAGVKVSTIARSGAECSVLVGAATGLGSRFCVQAMGQTSLGIVCFGLNEAANGITTASFKANMTTLITDLKSTMGASVLIVAAPPPNPTLISALTWSSFRSAMQELSSSLQTGFLDMADYWTSYAVSGAAYYFDNVHPNNAGHAALGAIVSNYILGAIGA